MDVHPLRTFTKYVKYSSLGELMGRSTRQYKMSTPLTPSDRTSVCHPTSWTTLFYSKDREDGTDRRSPETRGLGVPVGVC